MSYPSSVLQHWRSPPEVLGLHGDKQLTPIVLSSWWLTYESVLSVILSVHVSFHSSSGKARFDLCTQEANNGSHP